MLGTLIESQAHVDRHARGSLVSIAAHGALIVSAIMATGPKNLTPSTSRAVEIFHVEPPSPVPPVREPPRPVPPAQASAAAISPAPAIMIPLVLPSEIAAIDLTAVPDYPAALRSLGTDRICALACPETSPGNGEGHEPALWSSSELRMRLREEPVPPRYPERLRRAGIEGSVVVKFLVDTLGRVDLASIEVISSTHAELTVAVRETLGRLRFNPARVGNRNIPATAIMPFHFKIR